LVVANVYPLTGTTEKTDEYQRAELHRIFPKLQRCSVAAHRVPVQLGHFVDLKINTRTRPADAEAVNAVMEAFNPLAKFDLPSRPRQTIVVCREPGRPRPKDDCWHENGMAVAAGNVRTPRDGFFDITMSMVVNNVTRGA
jgi:aspartate-semialdehyde dehydrogenase